MVGMLAVGGDFESLKAEIKRREERGEDGVADNLRKYLAKLEALQLQQRSLDTPYGPD